MSTSEQQYSTFLLENQKDPMHDVGAIGGKPLLLLAFYLDRSSDVQASGVAPRVAFLPC